VTAADNDNTDPRDTVQVLGALTWTDVVDLTNSPIDFIGTGRGAGGTFIDDPNNEPAVEIGADSTAQSFRARSPGGVTLQIVAGGSLSEATVENTAPSSGQAISTVGTGTPITIQNVTATSAHGDAVDTGVDATIEDSPLTSNAQF